MAARKSEKERRREARRAEQEAAEQQARRRRHRIYAGLGAAAAVLVVLTVVIVGSNGSGRSGGSEDGSASPAAVTAAQAPASSTGAGAGAAAAPAAASPKAELAANLGQANQILDGDIGVKVAQLRGVPVVINQWASWCSNCRAEFPYFQEAGRQDAGRVAFVGLDSQDVRANARAFLRQFPVAYPSVFDPTATQAQSLGGGQGWPTTIFLNAKHQITFVHEGGYQTLQALQQDIARYASA